MAGAGKDPHYIRSWRKYRGYTLEKLAERIGMTHQNLGKIERFKVPYSQPLLERLAEELRCEPADLIIRDPSRPDSMWGINIPLSPREQKKVAQFIEMLKDTGTDG